MEPARRSLLAARELTPEERSARDEDPRPGVWAGQLYWGGCALTQEQSDTLLRAELIACTTSEERAEFARLVHEPLVLRVNQPGSGVAVAHVQRGGIDSDPLIRLLAYRAWGDRDRRWFEERGVRQGDPVGESRAAMGSNTMPLVALPWTGDTVLGRAIHDARPGEVVEVERSIGFGRQQCRVSDRLRIEP
jgi:hypothetical protein